MTDPQRETQVRDRKLALAALGSLPVSALFAFVMATRVHTVDVAAYAWGAGIGLAAGVLAAPVWFVVARRSAERWQMTRGLTLIATLDLVLCGLGMTVLLNVALDGSPEVTHPTRIESLTTKTPRSIVVAPWSAEARSITLDGGECDPDGARPGNPLLITVRAGAFGFAHVTRCRRLNPASPGQ